MTLVLVAYALGCVTPALWRYGWPKLKAWLNADPLKPLT